MFDRKRRMVSSELPHLFEAVSVTRLLLAAVGVKESLWVRVEVARRVRFLDHATEGRRV